MQKKILKDVCDMYTYANDKFGIQMSFDQYHKNCIPNAHKLIKELDTKLQNDQGIKYNLSLVGFTHDPDFRNNLHINPKNLIVSNKLLWDLNAVGRAKENNLPNCRDTSAEFDEWCDGDKLRKLIFTPLYPVNQQVFCKLIVFDCNGYANLCDAHNPENFDKFKTQYKNPDGTFKILNEVDTELAVQLIKHFYSKEK